MRRRSPPLLLLLAVACGPEPTYDDWGVAGYARVEGTVSAADGSPLPSHQVSLLCGRVDASEYFYGPALTDSRGAYRLDAALPGLAFPPTDTGVVLVCNARAAEPPPRGVIADSTLRIRFVPHETGLAPTILHLRVRGQP